MKLTPEKLDNLMIEHQRIKNLLKSDPELLDHVKWLCWNTVNNTTKTLHKNPDKIITRKISDNWMEYEAGLTKECIYNPYLED